MMIHFIFMFLGLFVALFLCMELGRRLGRKSGESSNETNDFSAPDGVVFAVLGLLIAFTFSASASRFEERRMIAVDHANALGTAWLRIDLLPENDREPIRKNMLEWAKLVIDLMPKSAELDSAMVQARLAEAQALQNQVWRDAVAAVDHSPRPFVAMMILDPINQWIDLTSKRIQINNRKLPALVMPTVIILSMVCAVLTGFCIRKARRHGLLHMIAFCGAIAFSIYVIIDLSEPRAGLIRVDSIDDALKQTYESMKTSPTIPTTGQS